MNLSRECAPVTQRCSWAAHLVDELLPTFALETL